MRPTDDIERLVKKLRYKASAGAHNRILGSILQALENRQQPAEAQPNIWRIIMKSRVTKLAAAAVIVLTISGGVHFWQDRSENGSWWLGPPAAWGQEIIAGLEKVEALVFREQWVYVGRYGSTHVSGNWSRNYRAKDRSRKDTYYEPTDEDTYGDNSEVSVLQNIVWEIPDGADLTKYNVSLEFQCYTIEKIRDGAYRQDPVEKLRGYVKLLDSADKVLATQVFDGRECIGFEISKNKYNKDMVECIWFDVENKLLVRIESHGYPIGGRIGETSTIIKDQFEYYAEIPSTMFEPEIPDGFINADPHEIRKAQEKEKKGEMVFAEVPKYLKEYIAAALKKVKTATYQQDDDILVYLSENAWRRDYYSENKLLKTEWFNIEEGEPDKVGFDFKNFKLIETTISYKEETYNMIIYDSKSQRPRNPMDHILFLSSLIDRADRFFENKEIEGVECIGFEISAKKYGDNPADMIHRLWFDVETKLPVQMELERLWNNKPMKSVRREFEWNPELDEDTFVAIIPKGFKLVEVNVE